MNANLNRILSVAIVGVLSTIGAVCVAQENSGPSKAALIKTLDAILPLLEAKDYVAAAKHVVLPPGLNPEELSSLVKNRELSQNGIRLLEENAKFGTAVEIFGKERAEHFAKKMGGDAAKCYGFLHETQSATAEIIAQWNGSKFQLIRVDDVGKLEAPIKQPAEAKSTSPASAKPSATQNGTKPAMTREQAIAQAVQVIAKLEPAVKSDPSDIDSITRLAMAYNMIGNFPDAWKQLMAAYKVNPKHAGVAKGINAVMGTFTQRGIFSVGVPTETVHALLGEPRQKVELGKTRIRWVYGHWAVDFKENRVHEVINLLGMKDTMFRPTETISTDLGGEPFRVGYRQKVNVVSLAHFFIPGEMITQFKQRITVERIAGVTEGKDIKALAEKMISDEAKRWPGSNHKVLAKQPDSVIMAVRLPADPGGKPWHQLVRLFRGPKDLHRLTYTLVQDDEPSKETQMKWMKIFQSAKLNSVK